MAHGDHRNCFTFTWKLENASYCWQRAGEKIKSCLFTVHEIHETNWKLELLISVERVNIGFYLQREPDTEPNVEIDCELAFLSADGAVLRSVRDKKIISKTGFFGMRNFVERRDVFFPNSTLLWQDTLTARCRIWKTDGEMSKDVRCFARNRIVVERGSFQWNIAEFSSIKSGEKHMKEIKSRVSGRQLMSVVLYNDTKISERAICFQVSPNFQNMKFSTFQLSVIDASENYVKCFQDEFWYADCCSSKDFTLFYSKLMKRKSDYVSNDVLSLWCEFAFSLGNMVVEIETSISDCSINEKKEKDHSISDDEDDLSKSIFIDNFKSLLNNSILSDVKLKTRSETYYAHKSILGARSPVFMAMFSKDMKEKINHCVDIEDLNDDSVLLMLRYIYSADVEKLEWASATELYGAADKYEILNLKDICSSYIKDYLSPSNACEALVLADLHHDQDLKGFVQDFILRHGKVIINSKEWKRLMELIYN